MKPGLRVLLLALAAAAGGGGLSFAFGTAGTQATARSREAELAWLRVEYHLDAAQFAAVQEIHHRYAPRSEEMYRRIARADERANHLISEGHTVTPEITAALKECDEVREQCQEAALAYVYAVADHMAPAEGARYVAMMKLQILEPGTVLRPASHWPR